MPRRSAALFLLLALFAGAPLTAEEKARQAVGFRIHVPHAQTDLSIDGTATKQKGKTLREFVTPPLEAGKTYSYTFVAFWEPNNYTKVTRTKKVTFEAGPNEIEVDLREEDPVTKDDIKIRYVPTPSEVVEAMLKMGEVGKNDVVYDLGCGDGRIVIDAVKKAGAKSGVGIDYDPERVKDSLVNAKKDGVTDKVEFKEGNVLDLKELPGATVVMLYLGNDLNLKLRPLLEALPPGSRVVSHRFIIGDWKPDRTETITDKNGTKYLIHLWKIKDKGKEPAPEVKEKEPEPKEKEKEPEPKEKEPKEKSPE